MIHVLGNVQSFFQFAGADVDQLEADVKKFVNRLVEQKVIPQEKGNVDIDFHGKIGQMEVYWVWVWVELPKMPDLWRIASEIPTQVE